MKVEATPHEHTGEGPSDTEKRVRKFSERLGYPIGVIIDSPEELSFQALNDTRNNMDKAEYAKFLDDIWDLNDIIKPENTELLEDPQLGLYVRVKLAE
jgi:hypothetical protein